MGSLSAVPRAGLEPEQRAAFEDLLFNFVRILNEIVGGKKPSVQITFFKGTSRRSGGSGRLGV